MKLHKTNYKLILYSRYSTQSFPFSRNVPVSHKSQFHSLWTLKVCGGWTWHSFLLFCRVIYFFPLLSYLIHRDTKGQHNRTPCLDKEPKGLWRDLNFVLVNETWVEKVSVFFCMNWERGVSDKFCLNKDVTQPGVHRFLFLLNVI